MSSPFSKNRGPVLKCKRDTHDLSFQNNLTMRMGYLYPCLCKEVSAGDSWHLTTAFGLRFLPTFFPIQTKIRAKIDYFYVRNRNIFSDWMNWRFGTGNPSSFPVLSQRETFEQSKTGSLGDYLGLPTTLIGEGVRAYTNKPYMVPFSNSSEPSENNSVLVLSPSSTRYNEIEDGINMWFSYSSSNRISFTDYEISQWNKIGTYYHSGFFITKELYDYLVSNVIRVGLCEYNSTKGQYILVKEPGTIDNWFDPETYELRVSSTPIFNNRTFCFWLSNSEITPSESINSIIDLNSLPSIVNRFPIDSKSFKVTEATEIFESIPYSVSALPFRAYEQIYNSFYRDDRNNPFLVDGVYDPNKFLPTIAGGIDSTPYRLHKRNWEQDFLTSAVPSPQFGNAPLVGITNVSASGLATLEASDGTVYDTQLKYDENDKVVGFSATPSSSVNSKLINLASSGISINDLRAVNSLQKYLELHYRRGLRYRDQMMAHRGIEIGYDELDMPEFIGSVVQNIDVSQVNQTSSSTDSDPLGSYAGQLSAVGGGSRLTKYCDEDGIIMGIISIIPVPCYSQLLPKLFTKINDPLEYFDPSFRNLGYQAIPYREVCPLQAANSGVPLDSTFGYNRAWYDYLQSQDEIHGQFRTTLNNYVLARVFNSVPSLNPDFLTVDPSSLNDIFSVSEVTLDDGSTVQLDTILGQIHFNIAVERQIPAYAIPSL